MLWLACETSTARGSLALFERQTLLQSVAWERDNSHSEFITLSFQKILVDTNISLQNIDLLAVGIGPGSFTGIRVGINFMRTLGFALKKPIINLNSLHLLALQPRLKSGLPVRVLQYAFRNYAYSSEYEITDKITEVSAPKAMTPDEISTSINKKTLVIGTGYEKLEGQLSQLARGHIVRMDGLTDHPHATNFLPLFVLDQYKSYLTDWIHTFPLYVRASEAEEKLKNGVLNPR